MMMMNRFLPEDDTAAAAAAAAVSLDTFFLKTFSIQDSFFAGEAPLDEAVGYGEDVIISRLVVAASRSPEI